MQVYEVVVRNELTGETETVAIEGRPAPDAQIEALVQVFRTRGWRKVRAFQPVMPGTELAAAG